MENPDHEIRAVVRSLCQGTRDEQRRTIEQYFTKDASFIHPFCIVPSFDERRLPGLGSISSRDVVRSIFMWYRMLSPKIEIEIDSVLHDHTRDKLYLDLRQVFSVWLLPFYSAPVRLVTVLDLVSDKDPKFHKPLARLVGTESQGEKSDADTEKALLVQHQRQHHAGISAGGHKVWKIAKQEDLYQVNEFLKFTTGTSLLASAWFLFQLGASAVCVFMSLFFWLSPWADDKEPARGGVEAAIHLLDGTYDKDTDTSGESKTRGKVVAEIAEEEQLGGTYDEDTDTSGQSKTREKVAEIAEEEQLGGTYPEDIDTSGQSKAHGKVAEIAEEEQLGGTYPEDTDTSGERKARGKAVAEEAEGEIAEEEHSHGSGGGRNGSRSVSAHSKASSHSNPKKAWKHKRKTTR